MRLNSKNLHYTSIVNVSSSFTQQAYEFEDSTMQHNSTIYHVSIKGDDANNGLQATPIRTISHAAFLAEAGDTIVVHEGTYRERIDPPRGGSSDRARITYEAAEGETVVIKGSEIVANWTKTSEDLWKAELPNTYFCEYNPYKDVNTGDWFWRKGDKSLKESMWLFRNNPENLNADQSAHLDELKQANLITAKAYQMRLNLQEIYNLNSLECFKRKLNEWCDWVQSYGKSKG